MTPWTVACQAPLCTGFSRQEYWSGLPFPSLGDLSYPEIKPASPALQVDSLPTNPSGNKTEVKRHDKILDRHSCLIKVWVWDLLCIRKEDEPVQDSVKGSLLSSFSFFKLFFAISWGMWDPSFLTRDWTRTPCIKAESSFSFFGLIISLFLFLFLKKAFCFILEYSWLTVLW